MSVRDMTFTGFQGDRKIDRRPEYWYAQALLRFVQKYPDIDPDTSDLICLCTTEDAAVLREKVPANHRVRITTASAENWNGSLAPLTFYIGVEAPR